MRNLCDEVAWLEHGKLRAQGAAGAIIDEYIGESHEDREADGDGGSRWGSGEGRIENVEMLDASRSRPRPGCTRATPSRCASTTRSTRRCVKPVFGMALHSVEGVHVTGPNTREAGLVPDELHGPGWVDLVIDPLMLLPGTYDITASLCDFTCLHHYDFRFRSFRFDVEPGNPRGDHGGVVHLGGKWTLHSLNGEHERP